MATTTHKKSVPASERAGELSHVDVHGRVRMVDVGDKPLTRREAVARGTITITPAALKLIRSGEITKGDPLQAARLAGIMAAKRTAELIPLCHFLPLSHVEVEALTAVAGAALTVYDMVKAVDKTMVIGEIRLITKTGGRSGSYRRP